MYKRYIIANSTPYPAITIFIFKASQSDKKIIVKVTKTCGAGPWPLGLACILEVLHLRLTPTTPEAIIQVDQRPIIHSLSLWITQVGLFNHSRRTQARHNRECAMQIKAELEQSRDLKIQLLALPSCFIHNVALVRYRSRRPARHLCRATARVGSFPSWSLWTVEE